MNGEDREQIKIEDDEDTNSGSLAYRHLFQ